LKPENILVKGLYCKLADFGLSKKLENSKAVANSYCGSDNVYGA